MLRLEASAGQRCWEYVQAVRAAAGMGGRRLLSPVRDDYTLREHIRPGGRVEPVLMLAGLCAEVEVSFALPLAIPDGFEVFLDTSRGHGCWMYGPGVPADDPLDVMGAAFDDCPRVLSALAVPELFASHRLRTARGWRNLPKSYRIAKCLYVVARTGLNVKLRVELEAR